MDPNNNDRQSEQDKSESVASPDSLNQSPVMDPATTTSSQQFRVEQVIQSPEQDRPIQQSEPSLSSPLDQSLQQGQSFSSPAQTQPVVAPAQIRKGSKKGLLIGIISGSIGLVLIVAAVLMYFLWWTNPQKMITDSLVNLVQSETLATEGGATIKIPNAGDMDIKFTTANNSKDSNSTVDFTLRTTGGKKYNIKADGVVANDGTIYLKASNLDSLIDAFVDMMTEQRTPNEYSSGRVPSENSEYVKSMLRQYFTPLIKKVDDRWIKISAKDLGDYDKDANETQTCVQEVFKKLRTDKKMSKELADAYRENQFLVVKDGVKIDDHKGARGFELDFGDESQKKAESFSQSFQKTDFFKQLSKCSDSFEDITKDSKDSGKSDDKIPTLRLWVTPIDHQLKRAEVKYKDGKGDMSFWIDFEANKPQSIEIPKDTVSLKDLQQEIQDTLQPLFGVGGSQSASRPSSYDYNI